MRVVSTFLPRVMVLGLAVAACAGLCLLDGSAVASEKMPSPGSALTLERIFSDPPLVPPAPGGIQWLPDSKGITYLVAPRKGEAGATRLVVREVPSGKERTLCVVDTIAVPADLKKGDADTLRIRSYEWADKGDLMKFHFRDEIFTFNRKSGEVRRRTKNDSPEENAEFSPDGSKIAFTRANDLWVLDLETNAETRLTTTGSDSLLNGVLDWVYEEEVFSRGDRRGFWWSPDSRKIAFLQFDETGVPVFPIVDFIPVNNEVERQLYPKPGDHNPSVRVGVIDLPTMVTMWRDVDPSRDLYIARVHWLRDSRTLAVEAVNRPQDRLTLYFANVDTGEVREVLTETSDSWVDITDTKHFYETSDRFAWCSDGDGYLHLHLYANDGTIERRLTDGDWDITELNKVDEKKGLLYFTGLEKSLRERHLYRVSEKGGAITRLTEREGTHVVTFSPDARYFYDRFSSVTVPRLMTVHDASGKELFVLDKPLVTELEEYRLPAPEFSTFTSAEGVTFHYSMIKPRAFDPSAKYPVLIYTYGFPNAQEVRNRWGGMIALWHAMLAERGFIVFTMDGRGSGGYGKAWASAALDTIGLASLEDHVAGAEYLKSLPYVDGSRIGIWGWSGGGTMTALAMLKTPGVFRAGAAVAPVTDWRFYDSIYTERYMKLPSENVDGYRDASPANFAAGLEGALLIAHGTADDNVHFQNAVYLVNALTKAGKQYELAVYPGGGHGIGGDKTRMHLFTKITEFFEKELMGE
jgi:dipeptidyl-peptidase-4